MHQEPIVLVVEDDLNVAEHMLRLLERMNIFNLKLATNLFSAQKICADELPDIAILDICLGAGVDTLTLGRWLEARSVKIVYASGYSPGDFKKGLGKAAFVQKPVSAIDLERVLSNFLCLAKNSNSAPRSIQEMNCG